MSDINKGATLYGAEVTTMAQFEHWLAVTCWPKVHDQIILEMRNFRHRCEGIGFLYEQLRVEITEGQTRFDAKGVDDQTITTTVTSYRVKFIAPIPVEMGVDKKKATLLHLYVTMKPGDVEKRTINAIPIYNPDEPNLIVEDL